MCLLRSQKKTYLILLSLLLSTPTTQANLFRWVDNEGNTIFSDVVPPKDAKYRRESLNQNARIVAVEEAAKTKEQLRVEQRLRALRREQEKIISQQKSHDKVLLSTFRTENDMHRTLAGKLRAIEAQKKVSQGNLLRLENQLILQQKKAADFEREGKKVPLSIVDKINASVEQIRLVQLEIDRHNEKTLHIENEFNTDIERFVFLTQSDQGSVELSNQSAEETAANALGLYTCDNAQQCSTAWNIARQFVQTHSTTAIDVDSKKLIMSSAPLSGSDLSLSVSKIIKGNRLPQFFLDIRCRQSSEGEELCASSKATDIRKAFKTYIESALGSVNK